MYKDFMKKIVFVFAIIFFSLILPKKTFAQQIITGNVSAKSEVHTQVEGNSNVQTNIEVEVNGEKKILSATGSGDYKVEINSSSSNFITPKISMAPVVKVNIPKIKQHKPPVLKFKNIFQNLFESLKALFRI
jgi:hypothetical protein